MRWARLKGVYWYSKVQGNLSGTILLSLSSPISHKLTVSLVSENVMNIYIGILWDFEPVFSKEFHWTIRYHHEVSISNAIQLKTQSLKGSRLYVSNHKALFSFKLIPPDTKLSGFTICLQYNIRPYNIVNNIW